jgi:HlyD family secretion protein
MDMTKQIFKTNSNLPGNTSPDQLDMAIRIKTSKTWIMWAVITCMFIAMIVWSIFGTVYTRVSGKGLILPKPAEIFDATSQGNGLLLSLYIKLGDKVKKGQVLAVLNVKGLQKQVEETKKYLSKLKFQEKQISHKIIKQENYLDVYTKKFNKALNVQENNSEKYKTFMSKFVDDEKRIEKEGAISLLTFEKAVDTLFKIENNIFAIISKRSSQKLSRERYRFEWMKEDLNIKLQILKAENKLAEQQLKLERWQLIRSPINGIINQILARPGTFLKSGISVCSVVAESKQDDVVGFFSSFTGKRITKNMLAFVAPSTAKKEIYGTIKSKVETVSEYPLDLETLISILKEPDLAKLFSKKGPPIMCKLSLERNKNTYSGFDWTSQKGPHFKITNGTICDLYVVVEKRRPITLVIPFLRKLVGITYE